MKGAETIEKGIIRLKSAGKGTRYRATVRLGAGGKGFRRSHTCDTLTEARAWRKQALEDLKRAQAQGEHIPSPVETNSATLSLGALVKDAFFAKAKHKKFSPEDIAQKKLPQNMLNELSVAKKLAKSKLGKKDIRKIKPFDILDYLADRQEQVAISTLQRWDIPLINRAYKRLIKAYRVNIPNMMEITKELEDFAPYSEIPETEPVFIEDELRKSLFAVGQKYYPRLLLALEFSLETGLRRREFLEAKFSHLRQKNHYLYVPEENAKERKSKEIYVSGRARELIKVFRDSSESDLIYDFPYYRVESFKSTVEDFRSKLVEHVKEHHENDKELIEKAEQFAWKWLRHQAIKDFEMKGLSLSFICKQVGHSTKYITDRYLKRSSDKATTAVYKSILG